MLNTGKDVQHQEECLGAGRTEWILTSRKDTQYREGCSGAGRTGRTLSTRKEAPRCSHSPGACVPPRLVLEQHPWLGSLFPEGGRAQAAAICAFNFQSMRLHCLAAAQLWKGTGSRILGGTRGNNSGIGTSSTTALSTGSGGRSRVGTWQGTAPQWLTAARERHVLLPPSPPFLSR